MSVTSEQADEMKARVTRLAKDRAAIVRAESHTADDVTALEIHGRTTVSQFGYTGRGPENAQNLAHSERTPKTGTTIADKAERNAGAEIAQPQTATQRTQALGRLPKGVMNNTERAYARHLEALKFTGEILDYWFEEIKFKIGTSACWYEPDFLVQVKGGAMEIHECKGHWQDDALVKVKALALRYPFRVIAVRLLKGNWEIREFN